VYISLPPHEAWSFFVENWSFTGLSRRLLAAAEYPDPPNFCRRQKSAGKITAAVNAAEFGEPPQKLRLTFG